MRRVLVLFVGLFAGAVGAAPPAMKPGLWELTLHVQMQGVSRGMPATRLQHCYHAEDIKDLRRTIPNQSNCKVADWKQSGNTITYRMSCASGMAATGKVIFAGDHFTGVVDVDLVQAGHPMHMTQKYDARRIGNCK